MRHEGDKDHGDETLIGWGNDMVRHNDPATSHEAARSIDTVGDEIEALFWFKNIVVSDGITGAEFHEYIQRVFLGRGMNPQKAWRRSDSLRRRLTGLQQKGKLEFKFDTPFKPRRRDKRQIYYLTQNGEETKDPYER